MKKCISINLHRLLIRQEIKRFLEYKCDFIIGVISFLLGQIINIFFLYIVFTNIHDLIGWSLKEIIFLYGFSLIPKGIDHLFFDNLWTVSSFTIKNGDFDKYLIRPINPLFYIMTEKFQIDAIGELLIGTFLMSSVLPELSIEITILKIVLFIIVIPFSTLIYAAIKTITSSFSFWIKQSSNIMYAFYMVSDFSRYPATIYNDMVRKIITYIIPFAFTAYYPVEYFLSREKSNIYICLTIVISLVLMVIGIFLWKKGIKNYESSGS